MHEKKICIIHKIKDLDPRSFYKQGQSLVKEGYDTTIISFYKKEEVIKGIKFVRIQYPKKRLSRLLFSNYKFFSKALKESADIYHFQDVDFIPWAILLKMITFKKVIYDVHEAYPEYMLMKPYIPRGFKQIASKAVFIMERIGSLFFDAIITNDNFVLQDFNHKRKEVIFNFPILDFFNFSGNNIPYIEREYDIVFIGSLTKWHFIPLLEIAEILKEKGHSVKWCIVPFIRYGLRNWMLSEIEKKGLSQYIVITDTVPFELVPEYLNNSRIGIVVLPPYQKYLKNIPLKMFEYMGCGLPIVASDLPPARQFVDGKECAILVKHEPTAYADAIISLMENPEKAEEMGKRGKQLVFEKYNWTTEEKKLLRIYKSLLPV